MDKVIIRDLQIETIVGLYPWERVVRQTLFIDMDLITGFQLAVRDDDLRHTVDYSAVCEAVTTMICEGQFTLLETLADNVASMILETFAVSELRLGVYKKDVIPNVGRVGIEIERGEC